MLLHCGVAVAIFQFNVVRGYTKNISHDISVTRLILQRLILLFTIYYRLRKVMFHSDKLGNVLLVTTTLEDTKWLFVTDGSVTARGFHFKYEIYQGK